MNDNDRVLISVNNGVGMLRLNRPAVLNALDPVLMTMLADQMEAWETDESVRCILVTGSDKAFAAGADIGDMAERSSVEMEERNQFATWDRIERIRKPIVAAVNGFALGGGCELVMMCDIVIAGDTAQFGQPEIKLGVIPGAGGTQRLTRAVGKALAMDLVLTGRFMDAAEALQAGLVSRVVDAAECEATAIKAAEKIAGFGGVAVRAGKEAVKTAFESSLAEGVKHERKLFYMLFATDDQKEGMQAFAEKRKPTFTHR